MPKFSVFDCILAANVLWDFTCAFCILTHTSPFSTAHTHLWKNHTDRNNRAACHLMAYLVLSWGCLRLYGLVMATRGIVVFSYVMEALVFACEAVLFGTMLYGEALAVSCFSLMLALSCISFYLKEFIPRVNTSCSVPKVPTPLAASHMDLAGSLYL